MARIENSIKNAKYSFLAQIANLIVQFISRTIFIQILGKEYLGLNGLFGNILTVLSLADMGIGAVLSYTMYKPLAHKDEKKLCQLTNAYRKIYICIALVILGAGICIAPFLNFFINEAPSIPNLANIYLLYLINTVSTYFFAYKTAIITADQKNHIITINQQIFTTIANLAMIVALLLTHNFYAYLITQILFSIASNVRLSRIADKLYPYINNRSVSKLPKKDRTDIKRGALAMILHRVGGVVIDGTDNILISILIGLDTVGIYSNYVLIISSVKRVISMYSSAIVASVGNLNTTEKKERTYTVFKRIFFSMFIITTFCSSCLFCLLNKFIYIWLGEGFSFSITTTAVIIGIFYIAGIRQATLCFIDATGLFVKNKLKPILESITNLGLSIILTLKFGIIGIFLGTILSTTIICIYWEGYTLYKYCFKRNPVEYIIKMSKYIICSFVVVCISAWTSSFFNQPNIINFILSSIITVFSTTLALLLFTCRSSELKYFVNLFKQKILKKKYIYEN